MNIPDSRSGLQNENLQAILDAASSAKAATLTGQQQYSTPPHWAEFFASLLPNDCPRIIFDPQCAGGNLLTNGLGWSTEAFGWDIDARFEREDRPTIERLTVNCVQAWALLDELWPDLRFECQVANPPFGLQWTTLPGGRSGRAATGPAPYQARNQSTAPTWLANKTTPAVDSTAYTWQKLLERAAPSGYGYFIAAASTIERLGINRHPWVYLYQRFPAGFFPKTVVEPGVVHWTAAVCGAPAAAAPLSLKYLTLDPTEHATTLEPLKEMFRSGAHLQRQAARGILPDLKEIFAQLREILAEEKRTLPPWNIWLDPAGMLRIHLSTRTKVKRKLSREEILRLTKIDNCHPLTLTTEVESRKLLSELTGGTVERFYSISPEASAAITAALSEVESLATPIMPVTAFERVAYADELDSLQARALPDPGRSGRAATGPAPYQARPSTDDPIAPAFTPGKLYPLRTATYTFVQTFERDKVHFDEETQQTYTAKHTCRLSGSDRYIELVDDAGVKHRFMDRPDERTREPSAASTRGNGHVEHPEALLWQIFEPPAVRTVAEAHPGRMAENLEALKQIEAAMNQ